MSLNREQVVTALECCTEGSCDGCPYYSILIGCVRLNMSNALALIRELTEENERLKARKYMAYSDGRLEMIPTVESVRADTVRKMHERLKQYVDVGHYRSPTEICFSELDVANIIDQIAKELLEEGK